MQPIRCVLTFLFQFTPLREGRLAVGVIGVPCTSFQFTPLREGRRFVGRQAFER